MLEQTLSDNSLKTIERRLLSETIKLKRKIKEILPYRKNYYTRFNDYERAYNQVLEALDFYGLIK